MVISPTLALRRSNSSSRPSRSRSFIAASAADQGAVPPLAQAGRGDVELPGHGLQRLTAQQAGDGGQLAPGRVATLRPGTARGGAGVSVLGARRRPLGLVAVVLVHRSDLRLR